MDHNTRDQPDKASPRLDCSTLETLEAFEKQVETFIGNVETSIEKEEMLLDILNGSRSNTDYRNTIMQPESKPKNLFFYGSLMDPDFLRVISGTSVKPELYKASIHGFKLKMWGCYPTLVPGDAGDTVQGVYWQAENDRQLGLLQRYETHRYKPAPCSIHVEKDGSIIDEGLTFVCAGDLGSSELDDGEFSLERYQLYFKPDAFKH